LVKWFVMCKALNDGTLVKWFVMCKGLNDGTW